MKHFLLISLSLMLVGFLSNRTYAQDRIFTYTYQSNVLPKGQKELEVWNTFHFGREHFYRAFRNRVEYELGLGSRLQTAFYLNIGTTPNSIRPQKVSRPLRQILGFPMNGNGNCSIRWPMPWAWHCMVNWG